MSENKDAQYREEWEKWSSGKENPNPYKLDMSYGEYGEVCFLAGRKAWQGEYGDLEKYARNTYGELIKSNEEIALLKNSISNKCAAIIEQGFEINSLKKELEELRSKNYEVESGNYDTALEDIKKLRQLVADAKYWVNLSKGNENCNDQDFNEIDQWEKEAELILNGRGL